ncbi:unnamed protein product, partial [Rotaria sordida]
MLLSTQNPYATTGLSLVRTSIMLFDLGYEDRIFGDNSGNT